MPLPDLSALCVHTDLEARISISMPGGLEITAEFPELRLPNPSEISAALFAQLNASLAPLAPIFLIIEVVIALFDCIKAVEKAIASFPPRPDLLIKALANLSIKIGLLLKIVPTISVPIMVSGIIDGLITYFRGIKAQLTFVIDASAELDLKAARADFLASLGIGGEADIDGNISLSAGAQLHGVVGCARADLNLFMLNMNLSGSAVVRMINDVNGLLQIAGIGTKEHPTIPVPSAFSIAIGTEPIDAIIKTLEDVKKLLPPSGNVTLTAQVTV